MDVKTQSLGDVLPDTGNPAQPARDGWGSFVWFIVRLLVIVLVFRTLAFSPFSIPSESMLPRLMNGDFLLAAKWPYGFSRHSLPFDLPLPDGRIFPQSPKRGDVVIFKHPVDGRDYIKRVIGLPGDVISMSGGELAINGAAIMREPMADALIAGSPNTGCAWGGAPVQLDDGSAACRYARFRETLPGGKSYEVLDFGMTPADSLAPVTVPAGALFVMGDNRDNSRDSRFPAAAGDAVGFVPQNLLVGRASIIVWSTDGSAEWAKPWTWFTSARWNRIGDGL